MAFLRCFLPLTVSVPLLATGGGLSAAEGQLPPGAYRLQQAQIIDSQGFGRPMVAAKIFIPAGWQTRGGVVWNINQTGCGIAGTTFQWQATSPDGTQSIEILPEETWSGNNFGYPVNQQCPNVTLMNVKDYLKWYVERNRPGAEILDYRARPEFTEKLQHLNQTQDMYGGRLSTWAEGGEVLLGYNEQGREMRETIGMAVLFTLNQMPDAFGNTQEVLTISSLPGYSVRAPNGQMDFRLAETIRKSIRPGQEWKAAMAQHNAKMHGIAMKGAADRAAINRKTMNEISEINRQGYENRQRIMDESHEQFSQAIRDVDTYIDTSSNERYELPNTYDNVWHLNDGTFILTDDANFNPGTDLGVDGTKMETER